MISVWRMIGVWHMQDSVAVQTWNVGWEMCVESIIHSC